jgi:hypothetical protein
METKMGESAFEVAFKGAASAVTMALVQVLREDGIITDAQTKRVFLTARQHLSGFNNSAQPDSILTTLAKEVPGNG